MNTKKTCRQLAVFTDLDGTLLDHDSYDFTAAKPSLKLLRKRRIPLIICTSKTRAEITWWQKKLSVNGPYISENGGGVFIPRDYFPFSVDADRHTDGFLARSLGEPVSKLGRVLDELEGEYDLIRISDLSDEELAQTIGLSKEQAARSRQREYDLPFIVKDPGREGDVRDEILKRGFQYTRGGRFSQHHRRE